MNPKNFPDFSMFQWTFDDNEDAAVIPERLSVLLDESRMISKRKDPRISTLYKRKGEKVKPVDSGYPEGIIPE
ncbi:hypothetical protein RUND412_010832, partial [Rhizina undulata]